MSKVVPKLRNMYGMISWKYEDKRIYAYIEQINIGFVSFLLFKDIDEVIGWYTSRKATSQRELFSSANE